MPVLIEGTVKIDQNVNDNVVHVDFSRKAAVRMAA